MIIRTLGALWEILIWNLISLLKQESPPAWTQEAYRPPRGHSNFLLFRRGGGESLDKKFFSQSEHVSSQIWCQKFFPLLGRGSLGKKFFSSLNMYQAKSGVKNFSPLLQGGGVPQQKIFFPVWTCIKPNLVSKFFPFTSGGGGGSLDKKIFPSLNMYQAKSGVKNFSLYWDWVPPRKIWDLGPPKIWDLGPPLWKSETWDPPRKSETWDPPKNLRHGTPPQKWTDRHF